VLVATALGVVALALASPAAAQKPCWRQIQDEWVNTDHVSPIYPLHCYSEAIAHIPNDLRQYSSLEDMILAARQQKVRGVRVPTAHVGPTNKSTPNDPESGLYNQAVDSLGPTNADSIPLPLLILAGLSLILMAAGGAGLVTRRVKARKVPG
jgi:hypothetical protein